MDTLKGIAFFLTIPLAVTIALLLIAGGGDGKFEEESVGRVNHPKELVYEWLSQPDHREKWVEGLTDSKGPRGDVEVGSKLTETMGVGADRRQVTVEVLEAVYGEVLALRFTEPGKDVTVRYELSPLQSAKRTLVHVKVSGKLDGWWARLMEPVLSGRIVTHVDDDLLRLEDSMHGVF